VRDNLEDEEAEAELAAKQVQYLGQVRALKERFGRGLPVRPLRVGRRSVELSEAEVRQVIKRRFVDQACEELGSYLEKVSGVAGHRPPVLLVGGSSRLEGLEGALVECLGCRTLRWERSEYATVLGGVAGMIVSHSALAKVVPPGSRPAYQAAEAENKSSEKERGTTSPDTERNQVQEDYRAQAPDFVGDEVHPGLETLEGARAARGTAGMSKSARQSGPGESEASQDKRAAEPEAKCEPARKGKPALLTARPRVIHELIGGKGAICALSPSHKMVLCLRQGPNITLICGVSPKLERLLASSAQVM
jgi:hypothetical protein